MGSQRASTDRRRRLLTAAGVALAHLGVALVVMRAAPDAPPPPEIQPVAVALVPLPEPPKPPDPPKPEPAEKPDPSPPAPKQAEKPKPLPPRKTAARPTPRPPPLVVPRLAETAPAPPGPPSPSDADLAGATTAESGGGAGGSGSGRGGACNMTRRLQAALRRDANVHAAVSAAHASGGAIRQPLYVWNGDWIRTHGQDGAGLAALREAILWEVGFAPAACRAEAVNGLVVITLADGPAAGGRIVLGGGRWRWGDVLKIRRSG